MKRLVLTIAGLVALGACIGSGGPGAPSDETASSSLALELSAPPGFAGRSVRLSGARLTPADGKYPCHSGLSTVCIPFDESGEGVLRKRFNDLCPSLDAPHAEWRFNFTVYADASCTEANQLTGEDFNCYDVTSPGGFASPNSSTRPLTPGFNPTHILCVSKSSPPAPAAWDLSACSTVSTAEDQAANRVRYDCGCTASVGGDGASTCACSQGGSAPLPDGCAFDPDCTVVCPAAAP